MRRRSKKHGRKKFTMLILAAAVGAVGYKAVPIAVGTALSSGSIDFSSEPSAYAGDILNDYFGITGGEAPQETVQQPTEEAAAVSADAGPKPYPTSWNEDGGTVYPYTFERYSGDKFFGLSGGGQVMNETDVPNSELIEESRQPPDFTIALDGTPQVLIMHTHTTESFEPYEREVFDKSFNYRSTDPSKNVVMIGDRITEELEREGIGVIHDATIHDYPYYNGSYDRSAVTVRDILDKHPTIKVVLDIHRDAIGTDESIMQPTVTIDGKKAAQLMIISGCDDGTLDMPDYIKNFHFACALQNTFAESYPGLARPIMFDYRKYNQDITTGSLLIEVGSHGNTLEQVGYTGTLIGKSLAKTLKLCRE